MIIHKTKWFTVIAIMLIGLIVIVHPFLFRKSRIEDIIRFELPKSAKIIDYKFSFSFYGVEPFYAKVEIDQNTYESINKTLVDDIDYAQYIHDEIVPHYNYESLDIENVEKIKINQLLGSRYFLMLGGTTRVTYYIITKEHSGNYYLYVFY